MEKLITFCVLIFHAGFIAAFPFPEEFEIAYQQPQVQYAAQPQTTIGQSQPQINYGNYDNYQAGAPAYENAASYSNLHYPSTSAQHNQNYNYVLPTQQHIQEQIEQQIQEQALANHLRIQNAQAVQSVPESYLNPGRVYNAYQQNYEKVRPVSHVSSVYYPLEQQLPLVHSPTTQFVQSTAQGGYNTIQIQHNKQLAAALAHAEAQAQVQAAQAHAEAQAQAAAHAEATASSSGTTNPYQQIYHHVINNKPTGQNPQPLQWHNLWKKYAAEIAPPIPEKRFLVIHPDGRTEYVDQIDTVAKKHPNYLLLNGGHLNPNSNNIPSHSNPPGSSTASATATASSSTSGATSSATSTATSNPTQPQYLNSNQATTIAPSIAPVFVQPALAPPNFPAPQSGETSAPLANQPTSFSLAVASPTTNSAPITSPPVVPTTTPSPVKPTPASNPLGNVILNGTAPANTPTRATANATATATQPDASLNTTPTPMTSTPTSNPLGNLILNGTVPTNTPKTAKATATATQPNNTPTTPNPVTPSPAPNPLGNLILNGTASTNTPNTETTTATATVTQANDLPTTTPSPVTSTPASNPLGNLILNSTAPANTPKPTTATATANQSNNSPPTTPAPTTSTPASNPLGNLILNSTAPANTPTTAAVATQSDQSKLLDISNLNTDKPPVVFLANDSDILNQLIGDGPVSIVYFFSIKAPPAVENDRPSGQ